MFIKVKNYNGYIGELEELEISEAEITFTDV